MLRGMLNFSDSKADGKTVWNQQEYGTYGSSSKIERFVWSVK